MDVTKQITEAESLQRVLDQMYAAEKLGIEGMKSRQKGEYICAEMDAADREGNAANAAAVVEAGLLAAGMKDEAEQIGQLRALLESGDITDDERDLAIEISNAFSTKVTI